MTVRRLRTGRWLLAVAVLAGVAAVTGDGAAQEDSDGQPEPPRERVIWTDQGNLDEHGLSGMLRWRCRTATCVWPDGYGQIVADTGDGQSNLDKDNPRLNIGRDYTARRGEVIACVDASAECLSRFPPRRHSSIASVEFGSLWDYAGEEQLLHVMTEVRHHNPYRCFDVVGCWWPQHNPSPRPGNPGWDTVLRVAQTDRQDGRWGFVYNDLTSSFDHSEANIRRLDNKDGVLAGFNQDAGYGFGPNDVFVTFCERVLSAEEVVHCGNATPDATGDRRYLSDGHQTHRLDRPLGFGHYCFPRKDLGYPDDFDDRTAEYRQAGFGRNNWDVWIPWVTQDVAARGLYNRHGEKIDDDGRVLVPIELCGIPGRGGPHWSESLRCERIYPDRHQAFGPDGDPPAYVYNDDAYDGDGNLIGGPLDWVRLGGKHPIGQALEVAGDMSSLIEGDDRAFRPDWDTRSMHSYPRVAYDQHGNTAVFRAYTTPQFEQNEDGHWIPVCWWRH